MHKSLLIFTNVTVKFNKNNGIISIRVLRVLEVTMRDGNVLYCLFSLKTQRSTVLEVTMRDGNGHDEQTYLHHVIFLVLEVTMRDGNPSTENLL